MKILNFEQGPLDSNTLVIVIKAEGDSGEVSILWAENTSFRPSRDHEDMLFLTADYSRELRVAHIPPAWEPVSWQRNPYASFEKFEENTLLSGLSLAGSTSTHVGLEEYPHEEAWLVQKDEIKVVLPNLLEKIGISKTVSEVVTDRVIELVAKGDKLIASW